VIQRMSDEPLTECQECGAPAARVLAPPAIHFKGSGFHNTDYGTKRSGGNGGSDSGGESGGSGSSESKSDSSGGKSESKGDSKPAASTAD